MEKIHPKLSGNGIYIITSPTNKIYVGQSWNLHNRFLDYKKISCKGQPRILASLKKHGFENHKFEVVLQLSSTVNQYWMDYWEQFFMSYFKKEGYELMNLKEAGARGKLSRESRKKLSESKTGKKLSANHRQSIALSKTGIKSHRYGLFGIKNPLSRSVTQFSKDGQFIKHWPCIIEIKRELNIDRSSIIKVCKNLRMSAGGFIWKYKEKQYAEF